MSTHHTITQLLSAHRRGDAEANAKLYALIYNDLKRLAHRQRAYWQVNVSGTQ